MGDPAYGRGAGMKVKVSQVGSEGLSSRAEAVELLNFFDLS